MIHRDRRAGCTGTTRPNMGILDAINRIFRKTNQVLSYTSAGFVVIMVISILYDVFARWFFHLPTIWVIDMNEYLLVYLTFVPAAWILMNDHHVKVELLTSRLNSRTRQRLRFVTDTLGFLYCIVLAWQGWLVAWYAFERSYRFSTALSFPKFPVLVIIPIGAAWLSLAFILRFLTAVSSGPTDDSAQGAG